MNKKAFHRVALWAAGSFVAGLSLVVPHSLNAVASNDASTVIEKPKFVTSSCSVTLDSNLPEGKTAWATGDKPSFKITAVNDSYEDQVLSFNVSISAMPAMSALSRTMPMLREVESLPVTMNVPAGKTIAADVACDKALPAGSIRVQFTRGDARMQMAQITTAKDITLDLESNGNMINNVQTQSRVNR